MEKIFRTVNWTKKRINGEKLNHLPFADDVIVIADTVKNIEVILQEMDNTSRKCGVKMSMRKTKNCKNN